MPEIDPFTRGYQQIWQILNEWVPLNALVKVGNRVDMSLDDFKKFKDELGFGDAPELVLLQDAWAYQPAGRNSMIREVTPVYPLVITMQDLRLVPLNQIKWEVCQALTAAGLDDLGMPGFCRNWEITNAKDDPFGGEMWKRGTIRWLSAASIRLELYLPRYSPPDET